MSSPTENNVELTINDLAALRQIVDIASQRGAFRAQELESVGKTFNKLNTFIETIIENQKEQEEEKGE